MPFESRYEGMPELVASNIPGTGIALYQLMPCYCCEAGCGEHPRETLWAIKFGASPLCPTCRGGHDD